MKFDRLTGALGGGLIAGAAGTAAMTLSSKLRDRPGLLGVAGLHGPTAMTAHWAMVWGSSLVMLPALDIAPAPWKQEGREVARDAFHHLIYGAGAAYALLDRCASSLISRPWTPGRGGRSGGR